jgi:hypothetical protein
MHSSLRYLFTAVIVAGIISVTSPQAQAITVELAKKCREMSLKAYPPVLAGSKKGNSAEQRKYYEDCIQKAGTMPDTGPQTDSTKSGK